MKGFEAMTGRKQPNEYELNLSHGDCSAGALIRPAQFPLDAYVATIEAHNRSSVSVKSFEKMRARGQGPKWKRVGRRVLYRWGDVVAWIEAGGDHE